MFKALSDETRFKLVRLLLTRDLCVGALAHRLDISEAAVSQHLKQLPKAGLVKGEKRGYFTHYSVERGTLRKAAQAMKGFAGLARCTEGVCNKSVKKRIDCERR